MRMRYGLLLLPITLGGAFLASSCPVNYSFRSYLDSRFWQPFSKYEQTLDKARRPQGNVESTPEADGRRKIAFAGMANKESSPSLNQLREAYQAQDWAAAQEALGQVERGALAAHEQEELALIEAKLTLRLGEAQGQPLLQQAQQQFVSFLAGAQNPVYLSEARGWLARCHYLLGQHAQAAKIYLDELDRPDTVFSHASLVQSLRMLYAYNGSAVRLADHLEEFFDTPAHALFAVNLVTNPVYLDRDERPLMASTAKKAIAALLQHQSLFTASPEADALALALMRASLYMGDIPSALLYSQKITGSSPLASAPEFLWMKASCLFLQRQYAAAEQPLLGMYHSTQATEREKSAAAQGLIGVYAKLNRPVDQLHAALLGMAAEIAIEDFGGFFNEAPYVGFMYWPAGTWLFDPLYLLDVQLSGEQLQRYLEQYGAQAKALSLSPDGKKSAYDMVEYAQAVHLARDEQFENAAEIFTRIGATAKAQRMREASDLLRTVHQHQPTSRQRLEAQYVYADYLEGHSAQIFFNDMLWAGFQTSAFLGRGTEFQGITTLEVYADEQGLTREERETYLALERTLQDKQEERWRAFLVLEEVMQGAGHTELGEKAAKKALSCLHRINQGRFGRGDEIAQSVARVEGWLAQHDQQIGARKRGKKTK